MERKILSSVFCCGRHLTAYILTDIFVKCELSFLTYAALLLGLMSLWCLIFKSKFEFSFVHTACTDFCSTSVEFFICITRNGVFWVFFFLELLRLRTVFVTGLINGACLV